MQPGLAFGHTIQCAALWCQHASNCNYRPNEGDALALVNMVHLAQDALALVNMVQLTQDALALVNIVLNLRVSEQAGNFSTG
jgi:hypothetical protein